MEEPWEIVVTLLFSVAILGWGCGYATFTTIKLATKKMVVRSIPDRSILTIIKIIIFLSAMISGSLGVRFIYTALINAGGSPGTLIIIGTSAVFVIGYLVGIETDRITRNL